jgi:ribosomal protein L7/L12
MNYYAQAISLLTNPPPDYDWKALVANIAMRHPKYVIDAAKVVDWKIEARRLWVEQGEKVKAIKHCRAYTGMGLKEAKEAVEALEG